MRLFFLCVVQYATYIKKMLHIKAAYIYISG